MYEFQGRHRQARSGPPRGGDFTFRQGPRNKTSDRPLLTRLGVSSPEHSIGGQNSAGKFRPIEDLTDSEEDDTDVLRIEEEDGEPAAKRLRSNGVTWSNPDPYTSLPAPGSHRKTKDVVKLIRRSRISQPSEQLGRNVAPNSDDFISLDMNDGDRAVNEEQGMVAPLSAPRGPRHQVAECSTTPGKRKREIPDALGKQFATTSNGRRLPKKGRILPEWGALDVDLATPWCRSPAAPHLPAGAA
jgi:hypothetical protein